MSGTIVKSDKCLVKRNREIDTLGDMVKLLIKDANTCESHIRKEDSQFWRRALVRAVFALIEGGTYRVKQAALGAAESQLVLPTEEAQPIFSAAEILLLKEESYEVSEKGEPYVQPKFVQISKNVKFAFMAFARANKIDCELKLDDGWEAFKKSIEIRNRLTHPKNIDDLNVSDSELDKVRKAELWYREYIKKICLIAFQAADNEIEKLVSYRKDCKSDDV